MPLKSRICDNSHPHKGCGKGKRGECPVKIPGPEVGTTAGEPPAPSASRARSSIPGFLEDYILDHVASADLLVCVGTSSGTLELDHLDVVQIGE